MYTIERQAEIITVLERDGKVDVGQLAERFGASKETIRRDLRDLERENILTRTHGGAVLNQTKRGGQEFPLLVRGMYKHPEKQRICRKAAEFIRDGDTIFIDNSSTTLNLIRYIGADVHATIVTNSIQVLIECAKVESDNLVVIALGGIFRRSNFSTYGSLSIGADKTFYPNKSFLSCKGVSQTKHLTDASVYEVEMKRAMIHQSNEVYLLADHTKFQSVGTVFLAELSYVTAIVTDDRTNPEDLEYLKQYNINFIIAG